MEKNKIPPPPEILAAESDDFPGSKTDPGEGEPGWDALLKVRKSECAILGIICADPMLALKMRESGDAPYVIHSLFREMVEFFADCAGRGEVKKYEFFHWNTPEEARRRYPSAVRTLKRRVEKFFKEVGEAA